MIANHDEILAAALKLSENERLLIATLPPGEMEMGDVDGDFDDLLSFSWRMIPTSLRKLPSFSIDR